MEAKEEKYMLMTSKVMEINAVFPDDEPLFIVDGHKFKATSSDWKERLKAKAIELGY